MPHPLSLNATPTPAPYMGDNEVDFWKVRKQTGKNAGQDSLSGSRHWNELELLAIFTTVLVLIIE